MLKTWKLVHYTDSAFGEHGNRITEGAEVAGGKVCHWANSHPRAGAKAVWWVFLVSTTRGDSKAIVQPAWPFFCRHHFSPSGIRQ